MRGLILAGGSGSRLWPTTIAVSKQLLPIYDKPMIYYPLSVYLLAGVKDILIISTEKDTPHFQQLLAGGEKWGVNISYAIQKSPDGLAQAFLIGSEFIGGQSSCLILGDNIFYGDHFSEKIRDATAIKKGAQVFAYPVHDPQRYGVISFDEDGKALDIEEKPDYPKSKYAITGLYFYDDTVVERARLLKPSDRGELEITDLNKTYLQQQSLRVETMGRGMAWFDTGTCDSLLQAANFIETIEKRQGMKVCCPEEICWRMGYIDDEQLEKLASELHKNSYGTYLRELLKYPLH